ncbi:hypothetical protein P3X46_012391 [Hevea brasiliensis]|uniref:Cupin type-1 domain-containing protein n=1 Tax=Hevea brasiliensis TaxID=3981 RepID=A0ABQ9MDS4_HEVBR|nr:hypothetical protein P3X46_012391 [Hevea brasiliensis]
MPCSLLSFVLLLSLCCTLRAETFREAEHGSAGMRPSMVKKEQRKSLMVTEYGEISAVDISSGTRGAYHLEFMTLEPNSLFLPVLLHADMVFYVKAGSGKLSWAEEGREMKRVNLKTGDVYRLRPGSIFFMQSSLEPELQKLRIYAIYSKTDEDVHEPPIGAYCSIRDLVLGFDKKLLLSAFKVPADVIEEMIGAMRPPAIVPAMQKKKSIFLELEARFTKALTGNKDGSFFSINGGNKKTKTFNILDAEPDFENCNGWSVTVDRGDLKSLSGSNIGVFMVNLNKGSMMGPHWNPMATDIAIVLHGQGMVKVACSSNLNETKCKNTRFRVEEGAVFAVPRFYPMAQMSFNNDSFVFMGFITSTRKNYPQFLAGKSTVLQTLNKQILALSFNVTDTTIDEFLAPQQGEIILECTSCAEDEDILMKEETERERQEEERKREEEERKREEEEERKREEARKKEERKREEEKIREEEEAQRKEDKAREREEEEKRRQEQERRERAQKAAERRQKEKKRREEPARKEEEKARREEIERQMKQREEEEEEEARKERKREERGGEGQPKEQKQREKTRGRRRN